MAVRLGLDVQCFFRQHVPARSPLFWRRIDENQVSTAVRGIEYAFSHATELIDTELVKRVLCFGRAIILPRSDPVRVRY